MDWKKIKEEAKEKINGKLWEIWKPILVVALLSAIITFLIEAIFGASTTIDIKTLAQGVKVEYNWPAIIAEFVFSLLLVPASVGQLLYMLNFVRGKDYSLDNLKVYYPKIGVLIVMDIIIAVLVSLASVLFIIPGIILALAYSMVFYIFADNPEISWEDCLKTSREMMKGYKGNLFCFGLSFLGWIILCCLIIPIIWVVPYIETSMTLYYEELKSKN